MAIPYKNIKNSYEIRMGAPLNSIELTEVQNVEDYIDDFITKNFNDKPICLEIAKVSFSAFHPKRAKLMHQELAERYESVGWKVDIYETEDDGPNRPGYSYWRLSKKK